MRYLMALVVMLVVVGVADAAPISVWYNDFSTLDGVSTIPPLGAPYLANGGVMADIGPDPNDTGYFTSVIEMNPGSGVNAGYSIHNEGQGWFTISLRWDADPSDPNWCPDPNFGEYADFWLRLISSAPDPNNPGQWLQAGAQNYAFSIVACDGWQAYTVDINDWNETDAGGPFDPNHVFAMVLDHVDWTTDFHPCSIGFDEIEFLTPECPRDLTGDDDVDLNDLADLLSEYGCDSATITPGFDSGGFETYSYGDLPGQNGFQDMSFDADPNDALVVIPPQVIDDPTGSGMGKVVEMDPPHEPDPNDYSGWSGYYRPLDAPVTTGLFSIAWDQYRPDGGDNVWISDDPVWDGWWAIEWDSSGAGSLSTYEWQEFIPLTFNTWQHIQYKYDLDNDIVVLIVDGVVKQVSYADPDGIEGLYTDITDTFVTGDGPIYIDNLIMGTLVDWECPIDYFSDGKTGLDDLAHLLGQYGCGAP